MTRCPTFTFQVSIISKWLAKHKITKVSFKFTIRKRHVYIDIGWPWIWNHYIYLGIWNDDRTKIIVLPSFQLVTRINSQNRNETDYINVFWLLFCIWILVFPLVIIEFGPHEHEVFYFFQFLTRFLNSKNLKIFSTYLVGKMERCEKRPFLLLKMRKKISWNIKTKCITDFILAIRSSRMKDCTCHCEVRTQQLNVKRNFKKNYKNLEIFVYT